MIPMVQTWRSHDAADPKRVVVTLNGQWQGEKYRLADADKVGAVLIPSTEDRLIFFPWTSIISLALISE